MSRFHFFYKKYYLVNFFVFYSLILMNFSFAKERFDPIKGFEREQELQEQNGCYLKLGNSIFCSNSSFVDLDGTLIDRPSTNFDFRNSNNRCCQTDECYSAGSSSQLKNRVLKVLEKKARKYGSNFISRVGKRWCKKVYREFFNNQYRPWYKTNSDIQNRFHQGSYGAVAPSISKKPYDNMDCHVKLCHILGNPISVKGEGFNKTASCSNAGLPGLSQCSQEKDKFYFYLDKRGKMTSIPCAVFNINKGKIFNFDDLVESLAPSNDENALAYLFFLNIDEKYIHNFIKNVRPLSRQRRLMALFKFIQLEKNDERFKTLASQTTDYKSYFDLIIFRLKEVTKAQLDLVDANCKSYEESVERSSVYIFKNTRRNMDKICATEAEKNQLFQATSSNPTALIENLKEVMLASGYANAIYSRVYEKEVNTINDTLERAKKAAKAGLWVASNSLTTLCYVGGITATGTTGGGSAAATTCKMALAPIEVAVNNYVDSPGGADPNKLARDLTDKYIEIGVSQVMNKTLLSGLKIDPNSPIAKRIIKKTFKKFMAKSPAIVRKIARDAIEECRGQRDNYDKCILDKVSSDFYKKIVKESRAVVWTALKEQINSTEL